MKQILTLSFALLLSLSANAKLTLQEIRTASNNVIELFYISDTLDVNEVDTSDPAQWKVNGAQVLGVNRVAAAADQCDHFIYLTVPTLKSGQKYSIETPYGKYRRFTARPSRPTRLHTVPCPPSVLPTLPSIWAMEA